MSNPSPSRPVLTTRRTGSASMTTNSSASIYSSSSYSGFLYTTLGFDSTRPLRRIVAPVLFKTCETDRDSEGYNIVPFGASLEFRLMSVMTLSYVFIFEIFRALFLDVLFSSKFERNERENNSSTAHVRAECAKFATL